MLSAPSHCNAHVFTAEHLLFSCTCTTRPPFKNSVIRHQEAAATEAAETSEDSESASDGESDAAAAGDDSDSASSAKEDDSDSESADMGGSEVGGAKVAKGASGAGSAVDERPPEERYRHLKGVRIVSDLLPSAAMSNVKSLLKARRYFDDDVSVDDAFQKVFRFAALRSAPLADCRLMKCGASYRLTRLQKVFRFAMLCSVAACRSSIALRAAGRPSKVQPGG